MADEDGKYAFKPSRRQFMTGGASTVARGAVRAIVPAAEMSPEAEEAYHFGYATHSHGVSAADTLELAKEHGVPVGHDHHILRGFNLADKHHALRLARKVK